jgi:hypothetical protein
MSNRDVNPTQGFGATKNQLDWGAEETYWREQWSGRPYAVADRGFDYYRPAYRYGFESASRYRGRAWNDVEGDLQTGWGQYEHRGQRTWENVKDAVRDAWNRVTKG